MQGSFHRRTLPDPAIGFSDERGREYFKQSLEDNLLESYYPLAENFMTQGHPSFCGIGSLTMALNALLLDPGRVMFGSWRWFDESMLDCCEPLENIKAKGITLAKVACLARCNGAKTTLFYGPDRTIEEFRQDVIKVCSKSDDRSIMITSYARPVMKQSGSGHFSPIGAYNSRSDMVLIMDVARFKYPPHWVPLILLYEAMQLIDPDSKRPRGYLLVSKTNELIVHCQNSCREDCEPNDEIEQSVQFASIEEDPIVIKERLPSLLKHTCTNCCKD